MKQSRICPKCGSKEVILVMAHSGSHIYCGNATHASIWHYICCDCGYSEQYINKPDIKNIREYYNK